MNYTMIFHSAQLSLIGLICLIFASTVQVRKTPEQLALPRVTCAARRIRAVFGPQVKSNVHVRDATGATVLVPESEGPCGLRLARGTNQSLSVFSRYDSCYALVEDSKVVIPLLVQLMGEDRWLRVRISCPLVRRISNQAGLIPTPSPGKCDIEKALRVDCGPQSIPSEDCYKLGCCHDAHDLTCYYRLNACSLDGHFVFSVRATDTELPITPSKLIVKDQPQCSPVVTTQDTAIFKIGVMDCGAKMKVDGDVIVYEIEVEEQHTGGISKKSPFRLQVQCEYEVSDLKHAEDLRSLYTVTNPPPVVALGTMRVLMRIAKDASFTSFFPEDQLPLTLPLRKAAYVEVSIAQPSPDPMLSLRVRDCFAYPASRHSVWTLLFDGCPNPLDNMRSSIPVDSHGKITSNSQVRRFDVKTFAFVDPHTGQPSVEEMYFYCWVEICTGHADCAQQCTIITSDGNRQRREAASESDLVQLVSLGPLFLGHDDAELGDTLCAKQNKAFQVTVYILSGVGAALLFILLSTAWSSIRNKQKQQTQLTCDAQVDINPPK